MFSPAVDRTLLLLVLFFSALPLCTAVTQCMYMQNGRPVSGDGIDYCGTQVAACIRKVNKGSRLYATSCDTEHRCSGSQTSFSDDTYDYTCCYTDRCNNGASGVRLALGALALLTLRFLVA